MVQERTIYPIQEISVKRNSGGHKYTVTKLYSKQCFFFVFYLNQIRWTLARNRLELLVGFMYSTGIVRSFETVSTQAMNDKWEARTTILNYEGTNKT